MNTLRTVCLPPIGAALLATWLSGCVVVPAQPAYQAAPVVVNVPPPEPQVEYVGVAPYPGYIWISGFWAWQFGRHVWVGGHWSAPRPGYRWVPHAWEREGGGWRLHEGHWAR